MEDTKGYQMSLEEVHYIVDSCKARGLHFDIIEITGGEASLWKGIKEGVPLFATICDMVTLATNGNNPELIRSLGLKTFILSQSQATPAQMKQYEDIVHTLTINNHQHKKMPEKPFDNVLPSSCATTVTPPIPCVPKGVPRGGLPQATFEYVKGKVYNCPDCYTHLQYVPATDDIVCDFEDDFVSKFYNKNFNKEICRYCLGNHKVWNKIA
jgi:hypothetical protein